MELGEAGYLIQRANTQLEMARRAQLSEVSMVHLELSSLYLERAKELIDRERQRDHRTNVVLLRR